MPTGGEFKRGDLVVFNEKYHAMPGAHKTRRHRQGVVMCISRKDGCVVVVWDGLVSRQSYHPSFLKLA